MLINQQSRKPRSNFNRKNVHEQTLFRNRRAQPSNHNLLSGLRLASSFGLDGPGNPHHLSRGSRWPYPSTVQGRKRGLSRRGKRGTRLVQKSGWGFPRDQGAQAGDQGLRSTRTKPWSLRELGTQASGFPLPQGDDPLVQSPDMPFRNSSKLPIELNSSRAERQVSSGVMPVLRARKRI